MALMGAMLAVQAGAAITNTIVGMSNAKKDAARC